MLAGGHTAHSSCVWTQTSELEHLGSEHKVASAGKRPASNWLHCREAEDVPSCPDPSSACLFTLPLGELSSRAPVSHSQLGCSHPCALRQVTKGRYGDG